MPDIQYTESTLIGLLLEQNRKKAQLDMHLEFDLLGIDDTPGKVAGRYTEIKALAVRIIHIENLLDEWAAHTPLMLPVFDSPHRRMNEF